jgi:outer membrane protein assembly factor BamB
MKNGHLLSWLVGCCVTFLGTNGVRGQDWPQWRGPNRDGKTTGFTAPATWPKQLTEKWKVTVGNGDAPPSLVGDKLYVFTRQGANEELRCLDASTGKEIWLDKYEAKPAEAPAGGPHAGPRCEPTVADGKVVTLGVRGMLSCLDASTGKVLWRKDDFKGARPRFYTSSSPIIVDGLCIAELGEEKNGAIVAYDLASGEQKWKWTGDGAAYASPVLLMLDGSKVIVAETDGNIVGVGVADGKPLWKTPFKVRYNACTPVVDGQTIICSGMGKGTKALKIEKQGDALATKELWSNNQDAVQFNTPVLKDGFIYGLSGSDNLFCINAETGKTAWSVPKGPATARPPMGGDQPPGGRGRRGRGGMGGVVGYGSMVDAGSVLMLLTPSMELIVFEPTDKKYTELARIKVAQTPTYAYPVVSGNRIFVKDAESLTLWTID